MSVNTCSVLTIVAMQHALQRTRQWIKMDLTVWKLTEKGEGDRFSLYYCYHKTHLARSTITHNHQLQLPIRRFLFGVRHVFGLAWAEAIRRAKVSGPELVTSFHWHIFFKDLQRPVAPHDQNISPPGYLATATNSTAEQNRQSFVNGTQTTTVF